MTEPQIPSDEPGDAEERTSRLHNALAMEELVSANARSQATMIKLVESVRAETKARDRKVDALAMAQKSAQRGQRIGIVALVCLLFMAVFNAFNVLETRHNAERSAKIADDVKKTNSLLLDCVNSSGECGKWNAEQQRKTLDEIKKYELTGFYCIRNFPATADPDGEKFLTCMERLYPGGPKLNGKLD